MRLPRMSPALTAFLIAVAASISYHTFIKAASHEVHPVVALLAIYTVAFAATFALFAVFPLQEPIFDALRRLDWRTLLVGLAIVGIELGFLLAYRAGWNVNAAPLTVNVTVALLLIPVGLLLYREQLSWQNLLGVALCLAGLWLVSQRG